MKYPTTPDGRYFVVRGRLWRTSDPDLDPADCDRLVHALMDARRAVGVAKRAGHDTAPARARVDAAKVALGERGPVWWDDGAPDLNRHLARTTIYADWYAEISPCSGEGRSAGDRHPSPARTPACAGVQVGEQPPHERRDPALGDAA